MKMILVNIDQVKCGIEEIKSQNHNIHDFETMLFQKAVEGTNDQVTILKSHYEGETDRLKKKIGELEQVLTTRNTKIENLQQEVKSLQKKDSQCLCPMLVQQVSALEDKFSKNAAKLEQTKTWLEEYKLNLERAKEEIQLQHEYIQETDQSQNARKEENELLRQEVHRLLRRSYENISKISDVPNEYEAISEASLPPLNLQDIHVHNADCYDFFILGISHVKPITPERLFHGKKCGRFSLGEGKKNLQGALDFIEERRAEMDLCTKAVYLHVIDNDIVNREGEDCLEDFRKLVNLCRVTFGHDVLIFTSQVLPRLVRNRNGRVSAQATSRYNHVASEINSKLRNIPGVEPVPQPALRRVNDLIFDQDGVHMSELGLGNYIVGLKKAVQHRLGLAPYSRQRRYPREPRRRQQSPTPHPRSSSPRRHPAFIPSLIEDIHARPGVYFNHRDGTGH